MATNRFRYLAPADRGIQYAGSHSLVLTGTHHLLAEYCTLPNDIWDISIRDE